MSAKDRKASEAKRIRWKGALDGGYMGGYVTCSCGSQRVKSNTHLGVADNIVGVTYTCKDCGCTYKVTNKSRGQLDLEQGQ